MSVQQPLTTAQEEEIEQTDGTPTETTRRERIINKTKNLASKAATKLRKSYVDPHNVEYHVLIGKHITDTRQPETDQENPTDEQRKTVYVKCIQTSTSLDKFTKYLGLAKTEKMQKVLSETKRTLGNIKNLHSLDLEKENDYKFAQNIIIGNDVLQIKCTRAIQETGGMFIIELHNKDGLYNDLFVKGDFVEIRAGYRGAEGTDYELQTIMLGIISSVRVRVSNNDEIIVLHGKDYQNVLRDKSIRDTIIKSPPTGDRTHDMRSVLMGFHQTFTDDFGHEDADLFYRQLRSGDNVSIIGTGGIPNAPAGAHESFKRFMEHDMPIIQQVPVTPEIDAGYWDYLQTTLREYGYYMRLKESSVKGRRFTRSSPQLVIMPMNVLSSEIKNFVDRYDDPHDFKIGGAPTMHFEGNVQDMEVYEDTTFMKNRVLFKLKVPVVNKNQREENGAEVEFYTIESRIVYVDSDILLFPENYTRTEIFESINPYFEVTQDHKYILKLRNLNRREEEDKIIIEPKIETQIEGHRFVRYADIPIRAKDGRTIGLGDLIEQNQKVFGKRNLILTKDCLPLVIEALREQVGDEGNIHSFGYGVEYETPIPFQYEDIIQETIIQIIQMLIEHIYAVKANIGLSLGNPSVSLFDCCQLTDKRVLKKPLGWASNQIRDLAFKKDSQGRLTRTRGLKNLFRPNLAPMDSVGTFMEDFRIGSSLQTGTSDVVRDESGEAVNFFEQHIYGEGAPERKYIITYVDHSISASGFYTRVRFQVLPQYYTSEFLQTFLDERRAQELTERERQVREIREKRKTQLFLGKVIVPKIEDSHEFNYLTFMENSVWDGGQGQERGVTPTTEYYFDRAIVRIEGEGGVQVAASVLRQPYIYTPIRPNDTVILANVELLENRDVDTLNWGWVILGKLPTNSSFLETRTNRRIIRDNGGKFEDVDIYLDKEYKTGFDSSFVDLITGLNRHNQDSVMIINHNYETYTERGTPTSDGRKANESVKVNVASISKRKSQEVRRQKASLNLNADQPTGVGDATKGTAIAELATYEVDDSTGEGDTSRSYAHLQMTRKDEAENDKSRITLTTKGTALDTSKQSILTMDGEGNLSVTTDDTASIYGTKMTLIGTNTDDSNTKILALDDDDILIDSQLNLLLQYIVQALSYAAVPAVVTTPDTINGTATNATLSGFMPTVTQALSNLSKTVNSKGTKIGTIDVNNSDRKIRGAK